MPLKIHKIVKKNGFFFDFVLQINFKMYKDLSGNFCKVITPNAIELESLSM